MKEISLFSLWNLFSLKTKSIYRLLQSMIRNLDKVIPSIYYIAEYCRCSTRTVNRALKNLIQLGFLVSQRRAYTSNIYSIPSDLIDVDFDEPKYLRLAKEKKASVLPADVAKNVAKNVAIYNTIKEKEGISTNGTHLQNAEKVQKLYAKVQPYSILEKLPLNEDEKQTLTKKFSEAEIIKAYEDYIWYEGQGKKIVSPFGFMYKRAMAAKMYYRQVA
jgi:DNA-binding transcriptional regulator YhcF (GntR family)